ncbi:AAA family ATPase [Levilactobacillus zymae]|uniref:AAA family ATPase n=1 Tax=Levilactobacillus zymae TaxID=267363 RepID=UPI003FCE60A7
MLIDFTLKNFRSYRNEATLSMETGERLRKYDRENTLKIPHTKDKVLKSVAMFGANGSGKSTVIKGLNLMRQMVLRPTQDVSQQLPYDPFRLNETAPHQPTQFEISFVKDDFKYDYQLTYTQERIIDEVLRERNLAFPNAQQKVLFKRTAAKIQVAPSGQDEALKTTRPNALLLYSLQASNYAPAVRVFNWFRNDLIIFNQQVDFSLFDNGFINDQRVQKELNDFLRASDVNIIGLGYRETAVTPETTKFLTQLLQLSGNLEEPLPQQAKAKQRSLYTVHKRYNDQGERVGNVEIPLSAESTGTQRIVLIALAIISSQIQHNQKTLIFDEFEEGLHYEMAVGLLNLFNSPKNQNQFVLATHQLELLDAHIRTDQIYFTEKNYRGESDLYSLFDYGTSVARSDVAFSKRYIKGQFGAIPVINLESFQADLARSEDGKDPISHG